jgi:preprotein translocase subunit SecE
MASKSKKARGSGFGSRMRKFFRDTASEFKKVVWPSRKQVWNNTVVVLTTVLIFAVLIWAVDYGLGVLRDAMIEQLPKLASDAAVGGA